LIEDETHESWILGYELFCLDYFSDNRVLTEKIFQDYKSRGYRVVFSSRRFSNSDSYKLDGIVKNST
jgi:hypothetical protein